jgi:hypothetical protein
MLERRSFNLLHSHAAAPKRRRCTVQLASCAHEEVRAHENSWEALVPQRTPPSPAQTRPTWTTITLQHQCFVAKRRPGTTTRVPRRSSGSRPAPPSLNSSGSLARWVSAAGTLAARWPCAPAAAALSPASVGHDGYGPGLIGAVARPDACMSCRHACLQRKSRLMTCARRARLIWRRRCER